MQKRCNFISLFFCYISLRRTRVTNTNKYSAAVIFCKIFEIWCFVSVKMYCGFESFVAKTVVTDLRYMPYVDTLFCLYNLKLINQF